MRSLSVILLLGVVVSGSAASTPAPLPVEAFFSPASIRAPQVSPNGEKIAFLTPVDNRMAIGLFDLKSHQGTVIVRATDENIRGLFWKGNDHIVFYADFAGNESMFVGSTDLSGKDIHRLAESQKREYMAVGTTAVIQDSLPFDPEHVALRGFFLPNDDNTNYVSTDPEVLRVNVTSKVQTHLLTLDRYDREVLLDNAGEVRVRTRMMKDGITYEIRSPGDPLFREMVHFKPHGYEEDWEPVEFAADNATLYLICRDEHDRGALYAYDTRTRTRGPAIFVPPEGEIRQLVLSYDRSKLYGVAYESDKLHYHWFDPHRAAVQTKLEHTFAGETVDLVSTSADEMTALVDVHSDRDPGTYFLFDRKAGTLALFKRIRDLDPRRLQPMLPIAFQARDGLELHGYLTLPAGAEGKRVPLIIHPHGGPFSIRDSWGYDGEVQFLASRGYAVLQVNYRGSGGYGRKFLDQGRYQWGRAMQDDLTDAVHWAINQGIADPRRVAIYGASYGGYAALAGVTLTPDLYCCAVNYVGPSDLTFTFNPNSADYVDFDYQKEWVGPNRAYLEATSPVRFVDRIRVPTMHAYGDNDPRVKIRHWDVLESELKRYHKNFVAIEEGNQGHGFFDAKASIKFYTEMDKFFAEYLAPQRPAEAGRP